MLLTMTAFGDFIVRATSRLFANPFLMEPKWKLASQRRYWFYQTLTFRPLGSGHRPAKPEYDFVCQEFFARIRLVISMGRWTIRKYQPLYSHWVTLPQASPTHAKHDRTWETLFGRAYSKKVLVWLLHMTVLTWPILYDLSSEIKKENLLPWFAFDR